MGILPAYIPAVHRGQKTTPESLELELQMVGPVWVLGIKPMFSGRAAISPAPFLESYRPVLIPFLVILPLNSKVEVLLLSLGGVLFSSLSVFSI